MARADLAVAPAPGALVLDGQRSERRPARRCEAGWLQYPCKRRTCSVCGPRRRRLTARCLALDARFELARYSVTLTTRDPDTSGETFRSSSAYVWKALRTEFGRVEYFGSVEFTTGRGTRSGGARRMHAHYLVKGEAGWDLERARAIVQGTWSAGTGAHIIDVSELRTAAGLIHYLNLHHTKAYQRPPDEWRGMVERASKRYWHLGAVATRELARIELRGEAIAWRNGLNDDEGYLLALGEAEDRAERRAELRSLLDALAAARLDAIGQRQTLTVGGEGRSESVPLQLC